MTVFEFRTSDAGSNPSINWATTTAPIPTSFWDSNKFTDFWQMLVSKVAFIKPWYGSSLDCYLLGFLSGFTAIPPLRNLIRRFYAILTVRKIVKFPANPVIKIFAKKILALHNPTCSNFLQVCSTPVVIYVSFRKPSRLQFPTSASC